MFKYLLFLFFDYFVKCYVGDLVFWFGLFVNICEFFIISLVIVFLDGLMVVIILVVMVVYLIMLIWVVLGVMIIYLILCIVLLFLM